MSKNTKKDEISNVEEVYPDSELTTIPIEEFPPDIGADISDDWVKAAVNTPIAESTIDINMSIDDIMDQIASEAIQTEQYIQRSPRSVSEYKYREDQLLNEIKTYIDSTYNQHYATGKVQATEYIISCGHGVGYTLGNVVKYASRYGLKNGLNRMDILKMIHYSIIALYVHDLMKEKNEEK